MRALPLGNLILRFRLQGMDEIGKFDGILNEKNRRVVAHQIKVAFLGIDFYGKTANIAHSVRRAAKALDHRKAHEDRGFLFRVIQEVGFGNVGEGLVHLKVAVRARTAGVHNALGECARDQNAQVSR